MRLEESMFDFQPTRSPFDTQPKVKYTRVRRKHKRTRPKKWRYVLIGICLFLLVMGITSSIIGYVTLTDRYRLFLSLAHTGEQDLQVATALIEHDPFNTKGIGLAQQHFTGALTSFTQLQHNLASLPSSLTSVPVYGARFRAAKHFLPLAIEVAQAGLVGCTILNTISVKLHAPLSKNALGLTMADMAALHQNLEQVKTILDRAIQQVNEVQPEDLQVEPGLSKLFGEFHTRLPLIPQGINQAEMFLALAPAVLGISKPTYYLVEIMDSTELRPGGGFIGNYGLVTLSGARLTSARVIDTYLLDRAFERAHSIPFPPAYSWFTLSPIDWGLRDSNLDADFPTSARYGEMHYVQEGGTLPLAGVIAITPAFIEHILTLTGPIAVPEYQETVTAQNLIDLIHYHQLIEEGKQADTVLSADGYSTPRKHFTSLLGEHLLAHLHTLPGSVFPRLMQVLIDSARTKDIQLYFNADSAEKLLQSYHFDDSIKSPPGDGIFVVDANITPNKASRFLVTTVNDQVAIDQSGNAVHHTLLKFTWSSPNLTRADFDSALIYKDYVRVYLPSNGVLQAEQGWSPFDSGTAFGRRYWGGYSHIDYPLSRTIVLSWSVAHVATKDVHGWHYQYLIQRQAGAQEMMNLQVAFPACADIVGTSTSVVKDSKQQAHITQALNQDTQVNINYTC